VIPPVAGERVHEFHMTIDLTDIKSIEIGGGAWRAANRFKTSSSASRGTASGSFAGPRR